MWDGSMENYQDLSDESSTKILAMGKKGSKRKLLFSFASSLLLLFFLIVFMHF